MTPLHFVLATSIILLGIGFYGLLVIRNMLKILIAIQIMVKGAMIAFVVAGGLNGQINLGQSLAFAVIAVDTVVAIFGLTLAVKIQQHFGTLNVDEAMHLEG
ncbi:MAG: NADH-quinone oxidoreductase subunit K [Anaerolineae bacterium]